LGRALGGPLANRKHEQFCIFYVKGLPQGEAYQKAGYKNTGGRSAYVCATRLLRDVAVRRRINEMQNYAAEHESVSVASLMREISQVQRDAMQSGNQNAAIAAITAKAKLAGLWVDRTENENVNLNYAISDQLPTEQQWEAERTARTVDLIPNQMIDKPKE